MNTPLLGSMHLSLPLLLLLGKATIILLAALGITLTMQRASAGARHLVWLVTLATLLLVPALTAWSPLRLALLPADAMQAAPATVAGSPLAFDAPATVQKVSIAERAPAGPAAALAAPAVVARRSPFEIAFALWCVVAFGILASLAWSGLAVRRIVRHASPLEDASWRTPLYEVADRMGLADAPRLLKSDDAKMPFACGLLSPTIVLPADCDAWTLERRRAVLLHELAHVRRHDLLGHTLGRLACAFYWFHPLVWTAARKLRNESERACDDLALSCGTRATDYAEHLLEIVTSVRRDATPSVALAMARRKEFEGRMLAILDPELRHSSPTRRQSATLIGSLALLALTVGAVSPVARRAESAERALPATPAAPSAGNVVAYEANSRLVGPERVATRLETAYSQTVRLDTITDTKSDERIDTITSLLTSGRANARAQAHATAAMSDAVNTFAKETAVTTVDAVMQALGGSVARSLMGLDLGATKDLSHDERATLLARILKTDSSASLRRVAAWGLHEYATQPVAVEALSSALRHDADAGVREMAAWALGEGDDHNGTSTDALAAALKSDASDQVRATAAWALGEVGDRAAVPALVAALSQPGAAMRKRVLWAIGTIEPKQAPPAVIAALRDDDAVVRQMAAWALFQIEDPAAVGELQAALKAERNPDAQLAEIRAIGAMGDRSVEALKALVESPDPRMRSMAVHALAGNHAGGPWPWPWPQPRPYP